MLYTGYFWKGTFSHPNCSESYSDHYSACCGTHNTPLRVYSSSQHHLSGWIDAFTYYFFYIHYYYYTCCVHFPWWWVWLFSECTGKVTNLVGDSHLHQSHQNTLPFHYILLMLVDMIHQNMSIHQICILHKLETQYQYYI